jgi:hypothetical protein
MIAGSQRLTHRSCSRFRRATSTTIGNSIAIARQTLAAIKMTIAPE